MTSQEEKELLLQVVIKLAVKLIGEGGFVPFGAILGPGRKANILMPKNWKENADRGELEARVERPAAARSALLAISHPSSPAAAAARTAV